MQYNDSCWQKYVHEANDDMQRLEDRLYAMQDEVENLISNRIRILNDRFTRMETLLDAADYRLSRVDKFLNESMYAIE